MELNLKQTLKGIDSIQTVYAFAIALGLREIFVGMNRFFSEVMSGSDDFGARSIFIIVLFTNVILLGVRFFWVPRNLRRLSIIAIKAKKKKQANKQSTEEDFLPNISSAVHILVIIAHGALYYFICSEFSYIAFVLSSSLPLEPSTFYNYIILHICILVVNAIWIAGIANQVLKIRLGSQETDLRDPGSSWWRNNAICAFLAMGAFAVTNSCRGSIAHCVSNNQPIDPAISMLLPIAPEKVAAFLSYFQTPAETFMAITNESTGLIIVVWCSFFFFINSLFDFFSTGTSYLAIDDIDWVESKE